MARVKRTSVGGVVYHVLNRANARMAIFEKNADYAAFEKVMVEACERRSMRILEYCVMPNHWHMVLWPEHDGDLSYFVGWLTKTHTQRWHAHRNSVGSGHVYQGRFKSFPIQDDVHLLTVCRYVARNPVRAGLVDRAEKWRWSGAWRRAFGDAKARELLSDGPLPLPTDWSAYVNRVESEAELEALRKSVARGRPFGEPQWLDRAVKKYGLESTLRRMGRPKVLK